MDLRLDVDTGPPGGAETIHRLVRVALVVYLSPVILTVLAIGLVGMLAARIGRPTARVVVEGIHPPQGASRPMGLSKVPTQAREAV